MGLACGPEPSTPSDIPPENTTQMVTSTTETTTATTVTSAPIPTVPAEVALVVGDFGTGGVNQAEVAAAMEEAAEEGASWLITTGDNLYVDDLAAAWSEPFGWVDEAGVEVVASLGNHDVESDTRRRLVTEELGIDHDWYRTEIGEVVVLVLSGNRVGAEEQSTWLEAELEESAEEMVLAVFHQPAFSCSNHGSTQAVIDRWVPLFEEYDVDLVLNGHDHNYQRHQRSGVTYVVTGGGGADLYEMESCPEGTDPPIVSNDFQHHFLVMSVGPDRVDVEARSVGGDALDSFTVEP